MARAALCAVLALAACARAPEPQRAAARPLQVGIDLWAGYYPLVLADELGYLAAEGVAVEISIPRDTDRMLASFAAREYDAVAVSLGDVINVTRVTPDVRLVIASDESSGADVLFARTAVRGAEDLRGRTIGTNLGGFGELFVRAFLQRHGVSEDDVRIVDCEAAQVPDLLAAGELDLGHTWEPYAEQARVRGALQVFTSRETPGLILDGLIFHGSVLRERAEEVRALSRAWFRAVDWWRANRERGSRMVEQKLGLALGEAQPGGIRLLSLADNELLMRSASDESSLQATARRYVDFFVECGTLSRRPKADALVDASFLP